MYVPTHFDEARLHELHEFMRRNPFATIVVQSSGRLDADHIPLILDPGGGPFGRLRGHIARANSMWREIECGADVPVFFHGPDGYISPGYYPSKQEHDDSRWLRSLVEELTERHEAGQAEPWRMADAPAPGAPCSRGETAARWSWLS